MKAAVDNMVGDKQAEYSARIVHGFVDQIASEWKSTLLVKVIEYEKAFCGIGGS